MKTQILILLLLVCGSSCNSERHENKDQANSEIATDIPFDKSKWSEKEGKDYLYRDQMLNAVVYNDTIRTLSKVQFVELLGEPDYLRDDPLYLHYRISETRLSFWTMHTKTMVVKLTEEDTIEWIKIHE